MIGSISRRQSTRDVNRSRRNRRPRSKTIGSCGLRIGPLTVSAYRNMSFIVSHLTEISSASEPKLRARHPASKPPPADASTPGSVHPGDPETGRMTDRYGRMLATISVNGRDVGDMLISENLARPWEGKRRSWCD